MRFFFLINPPYGRPAAIARRKKGNSPAMDILETQVSDLRSFLTHPAPAGPGPGTGGPTAISPRHPSAHPGSPLSAPGDNSALPSPFASGTGGGATGAAYGARNGAGKRKADGDDGSGKAQRSKRNRVCAVVVLVLALCRVLLRPTGRQSC